MKRSAGVNLTRVMEVLGGVRPLPRSWARSSPAGVGLGLWWLFLLVAVLAFVGRSTKFIYVDF